MNKYIRVVAKPPTFVAIQFVGNNWKDCCEAFPQLKYAYQGQQGHLWLPEKPSQSPISTKQLVDCGDWIVSTFDWPIVCQNWEFEAKYQRNPNLCP